MENEGDTYGRGKMHITLDNNADANNADITDAVLTATSDKLIGIGTQDPTAKLNVVGGADVLIVEGSGSTANTTIFAIDGNNGRLFEISDDLSDSLFSVNTIAGLPVMEAFSDNTVVLGAYNQNDLVITGSLVGIGTATPSYKLDINGTGRFTGRLYLDTLDTNTSSTAALVMNGSEVEKRTLGSNAFTSTGYLPLTGGTLSGTLTTRHVIPSADRTYDLGTDAARYRIVFCETLDSAGLHETNLASGSVAELATGTVLVWQNGENTPCTVEADHMRMGIAVNGNASPLIQGAEPVLCTGVVNEGDYLITSAVEGHAKGISREEMLQRNLYDCVLGKALEDGSGESYLLKTWITI